MPVHPWNRRKKETLKAFGAFNQYLRMGSQRSISKLAEEMKKHPQQLYAWQRKHDWRDRLGAYEDWLAQKDAEGAARAREVLSFNRETLFLESGQRLFKKGEDLAMALDEDESFDRAKAAQLVKVGADLIDKGLGNPDLVVEVKVMAVVVNKIMGIMFEEITCPKAQARIKRKIKAAMNAANECSE